MPTARAAELDRQQALSYDPYGLMPEAMPAFPRVLVTAEDIARSRRLSGKQRWAKLSLERLLCAADKSLKLPASLPVPSDPSLNGAVLSKALRCALAYLLTDAAKYRRRAFAAFDLLARDYQKLPLVDGARAAAGSLAETHFNSHLGFTYDLLEACGLDDARREAYRALLYTTTDATDTNPHYACINHNLHNLGARLTIGAALGDMQHIHDALYGWRCPDAWRYGLVHQLQHDFLADGAHWERSPSYHMYVLAGWVTVLKLLEHMGVDLWHTKVPALLTPDTEGGTNCLDQHRDYGPRGEKCIKAAFDAIIYQASTCGQLSLVHDTGLATLACTNAHYGILYDLAYEKYRDPRYLWMLGRNEKQFPQRERNFPGLPMSLQNHLGDLDWVCLKRGSYPSTKFSFAKAAKISLTGINTGGCTLLPSAGTVMLRSDARDETSHSAAMFFGPHVAGHQSPAALHVDLFASDRRATDAPHSCGYDDPVHLTWVRSTIAHNTVTVDGQSMFPYDFATRSTWEADHWRERISDGKLDRFQPDHSFKAVRASNEAVYPGVKLDRTLIVTHGFVLDVYRAISDSEHQYDWAMHCIGDAKVHEGEASVRWGDARGYCHLSEGHIVADGRVTHDLLVRHGRSRTHASIALAAQSKLILAADPRLEQHGPRAPGYRKRDTLGPERTAVVVRSAGTSALFVSLWQIDRKRDAEARITAVKGSPNKPVHIRVQCGARAKTYTAPFGNRPVTCR